MNPSAKAMEEDLGKSANNAAVEYGIGSKAGDRPWGFAIVYMGHGGDRTEGPRYWRGAVRALHSFLAFFRICILKYI
jgi:hypothetical protein